MSAVSLKTVLNDNATAKEDVRMSPLMNKAAVVHQNHRKDPYSLPRLHLHSSPCSDNLPSDQVYLRAAAVFQRLQTEKPAPHILQYGKKAEVPLCDSEDKETQTKAYQLAFNTLKYQDLLEDVIAKSHFYTSQQTEADLLPLAMVMLFDFQDRRFVVRHCSPKEGQEVIQEVRDLETDLQKCKTKLAANLARFRVKHRLRSLSSFLCDTVRAKQRRAKNLPLYTWVNTLKMSLTDVCETLQRNDLVEVQNISELTASSFCKDPLCSDSLVFPQSRRAWLQNSSLTRTHVLNMQDRSVCLMVTALKPVLYEKGDVLVIGSFSALTVAHMAVATASRSGQVLVCGGDFTPPQVQEMSELLTRMDLQNVQILSEAFCNLKEGDADVQRVRVITVLPQCSSSALSNPVATIHREHGDWGLLPELSRGSVSKNKMLSLTSNQDRLLGHSLTFSKVQTVLYCTRSEYSEENEELVKEVLDKTRIPPKLLPFRVNGPIFPADPTSGGQTDSKLFTLAPSQLSDGCFIARVSRQADPTKVETVQEVLARAAAKGLLGGIFPELSESGKKGKSKKGQGKHLSSDQEGQEGVDLDKEDEKEEDEGEHEGEGKGKKKRRKKGAKRLSKKTDASKKPSKKKGGQSLKKKQSKPKKIPRLTLSLISSEQPSNSLSRITALAHKISNPAGRPQQRELSSHSKGRAYSAAAAGDAQSADHSPSRRQKTLKESGKRRRQVQPVTPGSTQETLRPADNVLPPIPSAASNHLQSGDGSPIFKTPSPKQNSTSASSSSMSLPDFLKKSAVD